MYFPICDKTADNQLFIAAWFVWFEEFSPGGLHHDPRTGSMQQGMLNGTLEEVIKARSRFALDVLCRFLVHNTFGINPDTRQVTGDFITRNADVIEPAVATNPETNRQVTGVRLSKKGLDSWDKTPEDTRNHLMDEVTGWFEADGDGPNGENRFVQPPLTPPPSLPPNASRGESPSREGLLEELVKSIQIEEFIPAYRRRPMNGIIYGWNNRLRAYFWPNPNYNYEIVCKLVADLVNNMPDRNAGNNGQALIEWANRIFIWGGVPQNPNNVTRFNICNVIDSALQGNRVNNAPMNSGWTKIAAFGTTHLEGHQVQYPQVIWDSRVSTSICCRLARLAPQNTNLIEMFPGLGVIAGRGGTRPRNINYQWPNGYRQWPAQFAGSYVVKQIRDILNNKTAGYPKMPSPVGNGEGSWTIRGVEMVLFMDGY